MAHQLRPYKRSLFIFRRDLRLHDNTALNAALSASQSVVPLFILDPRQVGEENQFSRNYPAIYFMRNSLLEVHKELQEAYSSQLNILCGAAPEVIGSVLGDKANGIEAVYFNKDYTPFSQARDKKIAELCAESKVAVHSYDDALLHVPGTVLTLAGKPQERYGLFRKAGAKLADPNRPKECVATKKSSTAEPGSFDTKALSEKDTVSTLEKIVPNEFVETQAPKMYRKGGRKESKGILDKMDEKFALYSQQRDDCYGHKTTGLSSHMKFGTISVREFYWQIRDKLCAKRATQESGENMINELYWRDFMTHVAYFNPKVFEGKNMYSKYDIIQWCSPEDNAVASSMTPKTQAATKMSVLERWKRGLTGFPFVDAGMRELNATGFMHNRVRMVVASFLTKDLHLHWRHGEKYFAEKLVDYDPAVNNGSWQWAGSTGCDSAPYLRVLSPWLQQQKFDKQCLYIKKWVPELANLQPKEIHKWVTLGKTKGSEIGYPAPMLDHSVESARAQDMYKGTGHTLVAGSPAASAQHQIGKSGDVVALLKAKKDASETKNKHPTSAGNKQQADDGEEEIVVESGGDEGETTTKNTGGVGTKRAGKTKASEGTLKAPLLLSDSDDDDGASERATKKRRVK